MINEQSPQNKQSKWKKLALPLSLLFCIGWWVSGWFFTPPSWWSQVFTVAILLALVCAWVEFRHMFKASDEDLDEEARENTQSGYSDMQLPISPSPALVSALSVAPSSLKDLASGGMIRQFASIEDGVSHGWLFDKQIGTFNGQPLYERAHRKEDTSNFFVFDGLTRENFASILSDASVAFGRIRYTKPQNPAVSS